MVVSQTPLAPVVTESKKEIAVAIAKADDVGAKGSPSAGGERKPSSDARD